MSSEKADSLEGDLVQTKHKLLEMQAQLEMTEKVLLNILAEEKLWAFGHSFALLKLLLEKLHCVIPEHLYPGWQLTVLSIRMKTRQWNSSILLQAFPSQQELTRWKGHCLFVCLFVCLFFHLNSWKKIQSVYGILFTLWSDSMSSNILIPLLSLLYISKQDCVCLPNVLFC